MDSTLFDSNRICLQYELICSMPLNAYCQITLATFFVYALKALKKDYD